MKIDYIEVYSSIQRLTASDRNVGDCMREIITICSRDVPHQDWSALSTLQYDSDVESLYPWIPNAIEVEPVSFVTKGLWVGLGNPIEAGRVRSDMRVTAKSEYDPDDEQLRWLLQGKSELQNTYAHSSSLREIYDIAYSGNSSLANDAEWPLCLAFGAFAIRSVLRNRTPSDIGSSAPRVGIVVGFDDGDMLKIGEITNSGLVNIPQSAFYDPAAVKDGK